MTTTYIDPSATNNGDGTAYTQAASPGGVGAKNTWSGVTVSSNNTYLQRAGTTYAGSVSIPANQTNVVMGIYDGSTGTQITDGSSFAYINGAGTTLTLRVREGATGSSVTGYEVYGSDTGQQVWGIYIGNTASQVANNIIINHCRVRDITSDNTADSGGIKFFGSNVQIHNAVIYNTPTDGIFGQGNYALVERCTITDIGNDGRNNGDCIQLTGNATLGCGNSMIISNTLTNDTTAKQCINIQDTTGGSAAGIIENNTCVAAVGTANQAIFVDVAGSIVRRNKTTGGKHGIFMNANSCTVFGNLISDTDIGVKQLSTSTGGIVNHNTIQSCVEHGIYADNDTTFSAKNNIIKGCGTGLAKEGGATEDYNCYYNNTTDQQNLGGAASWGTHNVTSDPKLRSDYTPLSTSVINDGTYLGGIDYYGQSFTQTPSIGAVQYISPPTVSARTIATTTVSARTISTTTRITA